MELIERPNMRTVHYLNSISFETFKNDCIAKATELGEQKPTIKDIQTWYSLLKQFCKTNIKTKGITKRIYSYSMNTPAGLGGRLFSGGSMQGIWGVYRGALMNGIATDIDMSNAHPVILRYICKKHNIDCPHLEYYINNRDSCLSKFSSRNVGKTSYLMATNNDKYSIKRGLPQHFKDYDKEMKRIQAELCKKPEYHELIETIPEYKLQQNYNGSAINRILCYYENIILQHAIHIINTSGLEIAILMFDGCMIYGDHYDNEALLDNITSYVEEQMPGLNMKWCYKECDTSLVIPDDFDETENNNDSQYSQEYKDWKNNFEKEWCKIKNTGMFIRSYIESGKTKLIFQTKTIIQTAYEHECYFILDERGRSKRIAYIYEWLNDPYIRCYDDAKCIPPPLICPDNIYNLWVASQYESMEITPNDINYDIEAINAFENHMSIMCNHEDISLEYLKKWISHSIQKPAEKIGVCITLTGEEGIGKSTLINTLGSLYGGTHKVLETTAPEDDIFGKHNEQMTNAYLIVLSEVDKKNFFGSAGKYKALITDKTININPKGKTQFTMDSYHRIISATNNGDSQVTHKGDRRNTIIRCSDEKKGDKEYFKTLNNILNKPYALQSIYWWFKSMDISSFKIGDKITTEYHKQIIEHNADPVELFMTWFLENHSGIVEISSVDFLKKFDIWRSETRLKFGEHMNILSLLKVISFKIKPPADAFYSKKGRTSNMRVIDTDKMILHMKLEHLLPTNEDSDDNTTNEDSD